MALPAECPDGTIEGLKGPPERFVIHQFGAGTEDVAHPEQVLLGYDGRGMNHWRCTRSHHPS